MNKFKRMMAVYCNQNNDDGGEAVGSGNDARLALLNAINDQNDADRGEDYEDINDDGTTSKFVVRTADGETQELTDDAVHEEIIDHDEEHEHVQLYPIKVNGVERMVTLEELTSRAQKIESADQYLAEAAKIRNSLVTQQPSQDVAGQHEDDDDLALARAIQMGNEDEAVAAIRRLKVKGPSHDDLARTIDERLTFNEAINKFRTDFSDVTGDPHLNKMALDMDTQMIANGDKRPYYDRYAEIGTNIRGWVSKFKPEEKPVVDKLARKAAVASVPKVAAGKTVSGLEDEKEESTSDIIAGIANKRGGPQWMSGMPKQ